jgi:hypothetical protein
MLPTATRPVSRFSGRAHEPRGLLRGLASAAAALLAVGDFGVGGAPERELGAAMHTYEARNPADLLVTLGDNDYTESPAAFARNWRASFSWLRPAGLAVAGVLGNHDVRVRGGRYQFPVLGMPSRYYSRRVGDVQLLALDSNRVDAAQTAWLRRVLGAATDARWRIAVFHHPAYTCGVYRGTRAVRRMWVPLFERHGVQLVLSAHDHNYQRFAPRRGVTYVVHGGGNPRLYPLGSCPGGYPRRVAARAERGFLHVAVEQTRLLGRAVALGGRTVDSFVVTHPAGRGVQEP